MIKKELFRNMRNRGGLKAVVILIVLVIVASSVALYTVADVEKGICESNKKEGK